MVGWVCGEGVPAKAADSPICVREIKGRGERRAAAAKTKIVPTTWQV